MSKRHQASISEKRIVVWEHQQMPMRMRKFFELSFASLARLSTSPATYLTIDAYSELNVELLKSIKQDQLKKDVLLPAREKFLGFITKFLKKNSSGFLVGDSVTWVDLLISEHCATMLTVAPDFLDGYPEVKAHMEKVRAIPNLKKWIETRPSSTF
ncbi:glutathione S-transferase protein [Ancylostoma ceylanicum]|uniref:glutathione transferase n=2 Tax=Ancylostoma ceylanicum TaxID=53326 RepID=A0A0D6MD77_9BILA|nr:glutathione S-transferase protein [Ancylostoma ceylanicum]QHZ99202.1 glutathione S-transferase protein [Ancylostoma ceylanicum]